MRTEFDFITEKCVNKHEIDSNIKAFRNPNDQIILKIIFSQKIRSVMSVAKQCHVCHITKTGFKL